MGTCRHLGGVSAKRQPRSAKTGGSNVEIAIAGSICWW